MENRKTEQRMASTRRMIDAARDLFAESGYTSASLTRIAEKAGVVKGSISLRFGTKEALFGEVLKDLWERFASSFDPQITSGAFPEACAALIREQTVLRTGDYLLMDAVAAGRDIPASAEDLLRQLFDGSRIGRLFADNKPYMTDSTDAYASFMRFCRFVSGTVNNYRMCGKKVPPDSTITGLFRSGAPETEPLPVNRIRETSDAAILDTLMSDYDLVLYVTFSLSAEQDQVRILQLSPQFEALAPEMRDIRLAIDFYPILSDRIVAGEDREMFIRSLRRKNALIRLAQDGEMYLNIRTRNGSEIHHHRVRLAADMARDGSLRGYTLTVQNHDEDFLLTESGQRSEQIIEVLAERYSALYYVDAETGRFITYSSYRDLSGALPGGNRVRTYEEAVQNYMDRYVDKKERALYSDNAKLADVLEKLRDEQSYDFVYRYTDGWITHFARAKYIRVGKPGEPVRGFVMAMDYDDDRVIRHYVNRKLVDEYISIYYVDLETSMIMSYKQSDVTETGRFRSAPLKTVCHAFAREVKPAYREMWESFGTAEGLTAFMAGTDKREYVYEIKGLQNTWRRSVWQVVDKKNGRPGTLVVSFMEMDDIAVRKILLDNDISDTLSAQYDNVFCVDLRDDRFLFSSMDDRGVAFLGQHPEDGMRFSDVAEQYIRTYVHGTDRERIARVCNPEYLRTAFRKNKSFNLTYLSSFTGQERYRDMFFTQMPDEGEGMRFIWAFADADNRVRHELRRTADLQQKNIALNRISEEIIDLLGNLTEARDTESGEHIHRVKGFTRILATRVMQDWPEYGLTAEKIDLMSSASALHDVGKIMIPDAILLKPGPLTPQERKVMMTHCERGCEILKKAPKDWSDDYLQMSMDICRYHHEKVDGKGYPEGLKGDEIPIAAQIVAVADCFDALTTKRVYKDAYPAETAYRMITGGECGAFSDKILYSLEQTREAFFRHADASVTEDEKHRQTGTSPDMLTGLRILFVDDNEMSCEMGSELLEAEGAIVMQAGSGRDALHIWRSEQGRFDVILMDIVMPEMNGLEATEAIRATDLPRAGKVPIIALTSLTGAENAQQCYDAGMNAFMTKPFSPAGLSRILPGLLQTGVD